MVFKKFRLLGFYPINRAALKKETKCPIEAEELSALLKDSFDCLSTAEDIDDTFLHDFFEYVSIYEDEDNHLYAYLPKEDIAWITDVRYRMEDARAADGKYKNWFTPGEPFVTDFWRDTKGYDKYRLKVEKIIYIGGSYYYVVVFNGVDVNVKLYPFEEKMLEHSKSPKEITCIYLGESADDGKIRLVQDRATLIDELFEVDTIHEFEYCKKQYDYKSNHDYNILKDEYGLRHRYYGDLPNDKQIQGTKIAFWVKSIHPVSKNLCLSYVANMREYTPEVWFSAEEVFDEIGESDAKSVYFDDLEKKYGERRRKILRDLFDQYYEKSNLWVFSYMNYLDETIVPHYIKRHKIEDLLSICTIMIKMQQWIAEKSGFLDHFSVETRARTLLKSKFQTIKYERIIEAANFIKNGEQGKFIQTFIEDVHEFGGLSSSKEERIEVLINILRIYPEYLIQNVSDTARLIKLLVERSANLNEDNIAIISSTLKLQIAKEIVILNTTGYDINDTDLIQRANLHDILILIGIRILLLEKSKGQDELEIRYEKARFFRFLRYICPRNFQSYASKCGFNSLIGTLDDTGIFCWEMFEEQNVLTLCQSMMQAPTLETNPNNNYFFHKDTIKRGLIWLCPTGFVIIPRKHCFANFERNLSSIDKVRVFHRIDNLPLSLGSMLPIHEISFLGQADKDFILWTQITKNPRLLIESNSIVPPVGERILVQVKAQKQHDKLKDLLFVTSIDNRYAPIDGVIYVKEISKRFIPDCRTLYNEGDVFYATVISLKNDKLGLSIKNDVDSEDATSNDLEGDLRSILHTEDKDTEDKDTDGLMRINKKIIRELILLVDDQIHIEHSKTDREILTGYAHNICAIALNFKSFYYIFMLQYYAAIEQFNANGEIDISFIDDKIVDKFPAGRKRMNIINLLKEANNGTPESFKAIMEQPNNDDNDISDFMSLLLSYVYALKDKDSETSIREIKRDINAFLDKLENGCFSTFEIDLGVSREDPEVKGEDEEEDRIENDGRTVPVYSTADNVLVQRSENRQTNSTDYNFNMNRIFDSVVFMNFHDNNTFSFSKARIDENIAKSIEIEPYAKNGVILIVTKNGELVKYPVSSIDIQDFDVEHKCPINPYRIFNCFVVPTDCYMGLCFKCGEESLLYINLSSNFKDSSLEETNIISIAESTPSSMQAFILPKLEDVAIDDVIGKVTRVGNVDQTTIKLLQEFEVFIS